MIKVTGIDSKADRITREPPHEYEVDIYVPAFMRTPRKVGRIYEYREDGEVGYTAVIEAAGVDDEVPAPREKANGLGWTERADAVNAIAAQAIRVLVTDALGEL